MYLRAPGQANNGPSFRIHISRLAEKGLYPLLNRCITSAPPIPKSRRRRNSSPQHSDIFELYLPAPANGSRDEIIAHHLDTRNLFAWAYNIPLTGRTLGKSSVGLLRRINTYTPDSVVSNESEVAAYLDYQRYTDYRECGDHALAMLHFAETFERQDMWIDAFAHCVGLNHALHHSLEFEQISKTTRGSILKARLEMDVRLDRVSRSVDNFFETDLSGAFLGLHQSAREHFDRCRSFLHAYYIETYGFWPPTDFETNQMLQRSFYRSMYTDFRSLYHYLVDPKSTQDMSNDISANGGLCILQNIRAFDQRHHFDCLPHPLPLVPVLNTDDAPAQRLSGARNSLNPLRRRKAEREYRRANSLKALTDASNRDWNVSSNPLVRRFEQFEQESVADEYDHVSLVDGRKVRWILIYAILQTLVSVTYAPKEVRNPEALSYPLCCHPPKVMPWADTKLKVEKPKPKQPGKMELEPDINYLATSSSTTSLVNSGAKKDKERRKSLPLSVVTSTPSERSRSSDASSLRGFLSKRSMSSKSIKIVNKPAFCEIFVQGYGNGLNETNNLSHVKSEEADESEGVYVTSSPVTIVSRESSKSSGYSRSTDSNTESDGLTEMDHLSVDGKEDTTPTEKTNPVDDGMKMSEVHINIEMWDRILNN